MPAKPPKAFDVWFVGANTVYKAVPYNVVADWAQQGRLAGGDMVRPAGTEEPWKRVSTHELLTDYLPRPSGAKVAKDPPAPAPAAGSPATGGFSFSAAVAAASTAEPSTEEPVELPDPEPGPTVSRFEDDDEVDMIPLIDISMVLLVFFIMIQAAGALAPVDVPEMKYAGELTADPNAITVTIEKNPDDEPRYAVRVGNSPPRTGHEDLKTPGQALAAIDEVLRDYTTPPEVRIACRKDLSRKWVYEVRRDLEDFRKKGKISNTVATVVEAPEQK